MTSDEIRVDAQLLCGFQINEITAFMWVKDAAKNIIRDHPLAAPKKTVEVTITNADKNNRAPQIYQIQEELVRLETIYRKGERRNIDTTIYDCDETGNIKFYENGTYEVEYRYVPTMPEGREDNLPLADRYAEYIKYYLAARQRGRIYGQQDAEVQGYDNLFWEYIADADMAMNRTNNRHRRMPARF